MEGLKSWPRENRPPVALVFWSFRVMVGLGMLMIATGLAGLVLFLKKQLFSTRWFHVWCMAMTPAGFVAVVAGWIVTEVGRNFSGGPFDWLSAFSVMTGVALVSCWDGVSSALHPGLHGLLFLCVPWQGFPRT